MPTYTKTISIKTAATTAITTMTTAILHVMYGNVSALQAHSSAPVIHYYYYYFFVCNHILHDEIFIEFVDNCIVTFLIYLWTNFFYFSSEFDTHDTFIRKKELTVHKILQNLVLGMVGNAIDSVFYCTKQFFLFILFHKNFSFQIPHTPKRVCVYVFIVYAHTVNQ